MILTCFTRIHKGFLREFCVDSVGFSSIFKGVTCGWIPQDCCDDSQGIFIRILYRFLEGLTNLCLGFHRCAHLLHWFVIHFLWFSLTLIDSHWSSIILTHLFPQRALGKGGGLGSSRVWGGQGRSGEARGRGPVCPSIWVLAGPGPGAKPPDRRISKTWEFGNPKPEKAEKAEKKTLKGCKTQGFSLNISAFSAFSRPKNPNNPKKKH